MPQAGIATLLQPSNGSSSTDSILSVSLGTFTAWGTSLRKNDVPCLVLIVYLVRYASC